MSTPPAITIIPRASSVGAPSGRLATIRPSSMQTSRTSPSMPLAGSCTAPPTIRSRTVMRPAPGALWYGLRVNEGLQGLAQSNVDRSSGGRRRGGPRPSGMRCRLRGCRLHRYRSRPGSAKDAWLARGPIATVSMRPEPLPLQGPSTGRPHHQRRTEAPPCTSWSSPRAPGALPRISSGIVHRERVASLPGQHRFGPGPVSSRPEAAQRGPGGTIERLGQRDQPLDSERVSWLGGWLRIVDQNGIAGAG